MPGARGLDFRRPYINRLKGSGAHVAALLGLAARIRQDATGKLPTREDWEREFDAFLDKSPAHTEADQARTILNDYFPFADKATELRVGRSLNASALVAFVDHCLKPTHPLALENKVIADHLGALRIEESVGAMLRDRDEEAHEIVMAIADGLANKRARWATGLRPFGWQSIRTGFMGYENDPGNDTFGMYLVLREARDWTTMHSTEDGVLVRDLLWIRSSPSHEVEPAMEKDAFDGKGRYFSAFNATPYRIEEIQSAGVSWHRCVGPPLVNTAVEKRSISIVSPILQEVDQNRPAIAMMTAHTRSDQIPGAWKALMVRIDTSQPEWSDLVLVEPEFEMFRSATGQMDRTAAKHLIDHLTARRIIGVFKPEDDADHALRYLFRRLLATFHPADFDGRLERVLQRFRGASDPIGALMKSWHEIEPTQLILPSHGRAFLKATDANVALKRFFSRKALGDDVIAHKLANIARPAAPRARRSTSS